MKWILILSSALSLICGSKIQHKEFTSKDEMTKFIADNVYPTQGSASYDLVAAYSATDVQVTPKYKVNKVMTEEKVIVGFDVKP